MTTNNNQTQSLIIKGLFPHAAKSLLGRLVLISTILGKVIE